MKDDSGPQPRLWPAMAGTGGIVVALVVLDHVCGAVRASRIANAWTATAAAAVALGLAACFRRPILRWLTSLPFSVGILAALLAATALGTVVVQGAPPAEFAAKYPSTGGLLRLAGLDDVFHSFAFRGLLGLLALSLALVVAQKRAWRPAEWPFALNHLGIVVILIGGLIGSLSGMKGFIDLREGQTARSFVRRDRFDRPTKETVALNFGLKLEKFEIERFPTEFRFYVYRKEGKGYNAVSSHSLVEATRWPAAGGSGKTFRLVAAYPEFAMKSVIQEAPEGRGGPVLQVQLYDKEGHVEDLALMAGVPGRDGMVFKESRTTLRFVWTESQIRAGGGTLPETHTLFVRRTGTTGPEEAVAMRPGESRTLGNGDELRVLEAYADFVYDDEKKDGASRSSNPANPAVKVSVRDGGGRVEEGFVLANHTDLSGSEGTGVLGWLVRYRYEPERKSPEREVVVVGSTAEVLEYRRGALMGRTRLPAGGSEPIARGVSATVKKLSPRAEEVHTPVTRSSAWKKPVAEVEIRTGAKVEKHFLRGAMPFDLGNGEVLVFQPKPDEVKSYRSDVSVIFEGEPVKRDVISVNDPLSFGGYRFYQSGFRREDPKYSGILVVKDPGLGVAYIGFLMICLGAIGKFYVQPWLQRRRSA